MNVDIRIARVEVECNWCHQTIDTGAYRLMWSRKSGAFTNKYYYHCEPDCWMEERLYYAPQRHDASPDVGRPRLKLSNEERRERELARKRKWWNENRRTT